MNQFFYFLTKIACLSSSVKHILSMIKQVAQDKQVVHEQNKFAQHKRNLKCTKRRNELCQVVHQTEQLYRKQKVH